LGIRPGSNPSCENRHVTSPLSLIFLLFCNSKGKATLNIFGAVWLVYLDHNFLKVEIAIFPTLKIRKLDWTAKVAQVVERLPGKREALSSNPSATPPKKKR
jgi:hypothetical protein